MDNRYGAFMAPELQVSPLGAGPLDGLDFAVKDVFAVAGHSSSAGNPDWLRTHTASTDHAAAVRRLLLSGASLRGATHTDELMYSLGGENFHYGTPANPKASGRIPGGSSSGSAVAVASGSVDFAMGTDTGGSIRVPSSYCGIYGFRPTHGAVEMEGVIPLSPSFDTVGWMADQAELLYRVGKVLLQGGSEAVNKPMEQIYIATDGWALAGKDNAACLSDALRGLQQGASRSAQIEIAPEGLKSWMNIFRELQGEEIWSTHGEWIEREQPCFGPDIAARLAWASSLQGKNHSRAQMFREEIRSRLRLLLGEAGCMVIPTVPGPAPLRGGDLRQLEINRSGAMMLCCIAGLAGLPQITLPVAGDNGLPIGLSVIGGYGQDLRLLSWINEVWE
ncbi:amidase [Paenibacillus sp. BR2-3]